MIDTNPESTLASTEETAVEEMEIEASQHRGPHLPKWRKGDIQLNFFRLLLFVIVLVLWQAISRHWSLGLFMSTPTDVWARLKDWGSDDTLYTAVRITLYEAVLGYVVGSVLGAVLGFILGRVKYVGRLLDPLILALYAVPKIALAPLFVLWFGIGLKPKVGVAALLVFFLVFYNTYAGTKQIDERLCDQARIMGAGRWSVMFKLVVPQAASWCFVGLRMALPYGITGAVVGEFISSTQGLGYLINNSTATFDTAGVFAGVILLMVIALILNWMLEWVERRLSQWSPENLRMREDAPM